MDEMITDVLRLLESQPELGLGVGIILAAVFVWLEIRARNAAHRPLEAILNVRGPAGKMGIRFDDMSNLDFGYGALKLDDAVTVWVVDDKNRRLGRCAWLETRSKKSGFSSGSVQLNEQDLYHLGVRPDGAGNWPTTLRIKARPAYQFSPWYWINHPDLSIKLTVRMTLAVLFVQEVVKPLIEYFFF